LQTFIFSLLQGHLCIDNGPYKLKLSIKTLELCSVAVYEVVSSQIESWSPRRDVSNYLHQPLLLKWVNDVFIALHVNLGQLYFLKIKLCL